MAQVQLEKKEKRTSTSTRQQQGDRYLGGEEDEKIAKRYFPQSPFLLPSTRKPTYKMKEMIYGQR